jgi:thioredoxin 1
MSSVLVLSDATFSQELAQSNRPVLVDFWAPWCGPCQMLGPVLEELAQEFSETVTIAKVNIDDNPKTPSQFGVRSIPTLVLFHQEKVLATMTGVRSRGDLVAWINQHVPSLSSSLI